MLGSKLADKNHPYYKHSFKLFLSSPSFVYFLSNCRQVKLGSKAKMCFESVPASQNGVYHNLEAILEASSKLHGRFVSRLPLRENRRISTHSLLVFF